MLKLPKYIGPSAFGLKMGIILPGMAIVDMVYEQLSRCHKDGLLHNGDIVCITESVVAKSQNNYVTTKDVAKEVKKKLNISSDKKIGVVFPIASRNRFSMILKGIAEAVPSGEVIVQFSFPRDEVGNLVICPVYAKKLGKDLITLEDLGEQRFKHPITGVDYLELYRSIIHSTGARAEIIFSNDPLKVIGYNPDGIIAADIHTRNETKSAIKQIFNNCISLDNLCTEGQAWSEWGLLGSNMSSGNKLKLAPRQGIQIVYELQQKCAKQLKVKVEVIIYGDGAYRDPSSGIYELADPQTTFAATSGLKGFREGLKLKYLIDHYYYKHNKNASEIKQLLKQNKQNRLSKNNIQKEGTTPRRKEDILATIADLISGSADVGTPVVLIKRF